jgi:hypothetical protein
MATSYFWLTFVPIAATCLQNLQPDAPIKFLGHTWQLTMRLPFSWKLFYFGAVAAACAVTIYSIRCPELIRRYRDFSEFKASGCGAEELWACFITNVSKRHLVGDAHRAVISDFASQFLSHNDAENLKHQMSHPQWLPGTTLSNVRLADMDLPNAFTYVYRSIDDSDQWARSACTTAIGISMGLTFAVFVQGFFAVSRMAV